MSIDFDSVALAEYQAAVQRGAHDVASDILVAQQALYPASAALRLLIAAERAHLGDIDGAEASYLYALMLQPDLHIARFQLGLLQFTSGRVQSAFASWAPLEQLGETHHLVYFKRAFAALAVDAFDDVIYLLEQGISRNADNPALNADMQLAMDETRRLAANASGSENGKDLSGAMSHMLASYQRNL